MPVIVPRAPASQCGAPEPDERRDEVDPARVRHRCAPSLPIRPRCGSAPAGRAATAPPRRRRRRCPRWRSAAGPPRRRGARARAGGSATPAGARRCAAARSSRCRRCSWKARRGSRPARPAPPAGRPRCPRSESPRPGARRRHSPATPLDGTMRGSMARGTSKMPSSSSSQSPVARFMSMVREALEGSVTWARAAGQLPDQPGVDVAEQQFAGAGALARAGHVVENPADLAGGEVGVDDEPGLARDGRRPRGAAGQLGAVIGRAAALPDDGGRDRLAGRAVPDDGGLALVGDADGGNLAARPRAFSPAAAAPPRSAPARSRRRPAPPSPAADSGRGWARTPSRRCGPLRRRARRARWWCLHRARERTACPQLYRLRSGPDGFQDGRGIVAGGELLEPGFLDSGYAA